MKKSELPAMPEVITLVGSTKFMREYAEVTASLTLKGKIVISVGLFGHLQKENLFRRPLTCPVCRGEHKCLGDEPGCCLFPCNGCNCTGHVWGFDNRAWEEAKEMLDELHLRKIDRADSIYVVNPGGYIGESTAREIVYAQLAGKTIYFHVQPTLAPDSGIIIGVTP